MARPSKYTEKLAGEICRRIAGGESLRSICKNEEMPSRETIYQWLKNNKSGFPDQYARARELQADALVDQVLDIITIKHETMIEVNSDRLKIDAIKWMAGKLKPKEYGDKQQIDHSSSDNSMSTNNAITLKFIEPKPLEDNENDGK